MYPNALNYDPIATCDDGTCTYPVLGCTDPSANNYSANATTDDGSCLYYACMDSNATSNTYMYNCDGVYISNANFNQTSCCVYCSIN